MSRLCVSPRFINQNLLNIVRMHDVASEFYNEFNIIERFGKQWREFLIKCTQRLRSSAREYVNKLLKDITGKLLQKKMSLT